MLTAARRWRACGRDAKVALVGLAVLLVAAFAVRAWLMLDYGPAFVGFGDSHEYVTAALVGVFHDVQKPAGYPIFLRLAHLFGDHLAFTILVQHALGLATGVLLFASVRRAGGPAWLGLVPAAVAWFGGTGVLLEHSLLGDCPFAFLQALSVYAAMRALHEPAWRWPVLAGAAIGCSFWVKTVGVSSAAVVPALLFVAAPGDTRRRLASAACAGATIAVLVVGYVVIQSAATGYTGYEREGAWNLYGRVATFVDCTHFKAPAGTRFLCPTQPLGQRESESFYQYARAAPAVQRFGGPAHAPPGANTLLERFSVAAIEHQPIAYAGAIVRSLGFYISPRGGEGYTPQTIREALLEAQGTRSIQPAIASYYPHDHGYEGSASQTAALDSYERDTRIQGPLLVAMLALALAGIVLLSKRTRAASLLFTLTALFSVTLAAAGNSYDARYGYPAFGPLAAGAALGGWALAGRVRRARRNAAAPVSAASAGRRA